MELWELLGIRPGLTAVIGSGGKTSLLRVLARELSRRGTVLLATTTHIMRPDWCPFAATAAELCDGFAHSPIVSPNAVITPAIAARVLAKEGGFDVLFINHADVLEDPAGALQPIANTLPCPVVYGSLADESWEKL